MERYSSYRDKGTGIAPFLPIPTPPSGIYLPLHIFLFALRVPLLLTFLVAYFLVVVHLPLGALGRKAALWSILGIPGIWWVDLQVDGVRRGSIGKRIISTRLPSASSIIVSSSTSPIDAIYLAAIFDPIFTTSYPGSRLVQRTSLLSCILRALSLPQLRGPGREQMTSVDALLKKHPHRTLVVLPECTTTNGRAILPFSPSLLAAPGGTKLFPVSLRYTPADVTTPVPGWWEACRFLWNLCSRPTHTIRVRIAEAVIVDTPPSSSSFASSSSTAQRINGTRNVPKSRANEANGASSSIAGAGAGIISTHSSGHEADVEDEEDEDDSQSLSDNDDDDDDDGDDREERQMVLSVEEKRILDRVGEALARLGRVKRVTLGVKEKIDFVHAWMNRASPSSSSSRTF